MLILRIAMLILVKTLSMFMLIYVHTCVYIHAEYTSCVPTCIGTYMITYAEMQAYTHHTYIIIHTDIDT